MKALALILTFSIITAFSHATPTLVTQPQINHSPILYYAQENDNQDKMTRPTGTCNYKVIIETSCRSPQYTTDRISISFGDAHGSEVFIPRLDDPRAGRFEQCTMVSFDIVGQCLNDICKLYLHRVGSNGWIPTTVTAYNYGYPPVKFYYNTYVPENVDYGFNHCSEV